MDTIITTKYSKGRKPDVGLAQIIQIGHKGLLGDIRKLEQLIKLCDETNEILKYRILSRILAENPRRMEKVLETPDLKPPKNTDNECISSSKAIIPISGPRQLDRTGSMPKSVSELRRRIAHEAAPHIRMSGGDPEIIELFRNSRRTNDPDTLRQIYTRLSVSPESFGDLMYEYLDLSKDLDSRELLGLFSFMRIYKECVSMHGSEDISAIILANYVENYCIH